jgi:hypothetical protein
MSKTIIFNEANINGYPKGERQLAYFFSIVTGLIGFLTIVGPRALYPKNIAWLGNGDPATHYLGWLFFRNSEWSLPVGLNPEYGLEISNSIIFSDSNPLLAIFFKLFSWVLPSTFQYFGMWILVCFILQAFFAFKLVGLITKSPVLCMLGACLLAFSPPMLWRLHEKIGHLSLVGHFFILASLFLLIGEHRKRNAIYWALLLITSASVHAYFLLMVGLIWLTDILTRTSNRTDRFASVAIELISIVTLTLFTCWIVGYFSVGDGVSSGGYGFYRMNLISIFDPGKTDYRLWSRILPDLPGDANHHEGFNFLGLGVLFLWPFSIYIFFRRGVELLEGARKLFPLFFLLAGLILFSLTNNIGIGHYDFYYPLNERLLKFANIFRASGRFFWPVLYTIVLATIFVVVRGYKEVTAIIILSLGLLIQIIDTSSGWAVTRKSLMTAPSPAWQTKMTDSFWNDAAKKFSKVRFLSLGNQPESWQEISNYAGTHGLATDAVYLARVGKNAVEIAQQKVKDTLQNGSFDSDSLYILGASNLRQTAMNLDVQSDLLAQINGFTIVAPGWKKCSTCPEVSGEVKVSDHLPSPLKIGDRLLFSKDQLGLQYLAGGWSQPEHWGTWSDGSQAMIILTLESGRGSTILVEANPLLSPYRPEQTVEVKMNGLATSSVTLTANSGGRFVVEIPEGVNEQLRQNPVLRLQLRFPDAARPVDIGINNDDRKLAIGLVALTVK